MAVSIRLQGIADEVNQLIQTLESNPNIQIDRQSREYLDHNSSTVRRYIEVELLSGGEDHA